MYLDLSLIIGEVGRLDTVYLQLCPLVLNGLMIQNLGLIYLHLERKFKLEFQGFASVALHEPSYCSRQMFSGREGRGCFFNIPFSAETLQSREKKYN